MTVKWAVANGNWADGTTWNDGVVPVSGDYVYCNGYTISFPTQVNIGNGTITNELNPNTGRNGGKIQASSGPCIITANLIADGEPVYQSGHFSNTISGNLTIKNTSYGIYRVGNAYNCTFNINGNVVCENAWIAYDSNATYTVNVNGNIVITNNITPIKNPNVFTINGNLTANSYNLNVITTFTINGNLTANYCRIYGANVSVGGNIYYRSNSTTIGIAWGTLNISNNTEWRDLTEPRSNPFIILTDAEMNNRHQYPAEEDVKKDVPYAYGQLVGTYTPNYPPESVVLKDYEYGDSDNRKTGTMEVVDIGDYPAESDVKVGVRYGNDEYEGTFQPIADYPAENDVLKDVPYAYDQMHGKLNLDYPPEEVVLEGYVYDNEQKTGTLAQTAPVVNTINVYKKK